MLNILVKKPLTMKPTIFRKIIEKSKKFSPQFLQKLIY